MSKDNQIAKELYALAGQFEPEEMDQFIALASPIIAEYRQQGVEEYKDNLDHEQQKFLDGFSHPKDCEQCAQDNDKFFNLLEQGPPTQDHE